MAQIPQPAPPETNSPETNSPDHFHAHTSRFQGSVERMEACATIKCPRDRDRATTEELVQLEATMQGDTAYDIFVQEVFLSWKTGAWCCGLTEPTMTAFCLMERMHDCVHKSSVATKTVKQIVSREMKSSPPPQKPASAAPVPASAAPVPASTAPVPASAAPVPASTAPVRLNAAPAPQHPSTDDEEREEKRGAIRRRIAATKHENTLKDLMKSLCAAPDERKRGIEVKKMQRVMISDDEFAAYAETKINEINAAAQTAGTSPDANQGLREGVRALHKLCGLRCDTDSEQSREPDAPHRGARRAGRRAPSAGRRAPSASRSA